MITESKVIELFCMADDFCKFFDAMMSKYTLKPVMKRSYHRASTMSKAEKSIGHLKSVSAPYCFISAIWNNAY